MSEKKRTIMLGFHSPVDAKLMREWVTGLGYDIVESLDDTGDIDLVLMDSATARRLMDRAFELKRAAKYFLPVLVCIDAGEDVGRWLKAGFDDVLRLPATKAAWRARIAIMLRLRHQSEALGRKSEMLHQALVESSSDQIFMLDANGTYVTSNDRVEHFGLERGDELVGKTIEQVYPKEVALFYRTQLQRVLSEGKTVVFEHDMPSDRATHYHLDTLYPVTLPDGTVMVGCICRDITERKQAEKALKEAQSNLQALLDNRKDSIWSLDRNYNYLVFNKPYADVIYSNLGVRLEKGINALEIHPKEMADFWKPKFDDVFEGQYVTFELLHVLDGKEHFFEVSMNPIYTEGEITGLSALSMDITERKRAEEELRKYREHLEELVKERTEELQSSNKELEAFAYSVSHDLRAPLRAIDGFTRILMEDYVEKLDDEGKRLGDIIRKNAQKMGNLIDDLLAFSRLGRASMHFSNIDMKNMVNAIYHELTSSSERKLIKFAVADLPDAYGDTNMLRQVWMNLISNAIKFSSKRGKAVISITGMQDDEKTTYIISDNGVGFDMQYANKIFDVFQRLHGETEYPGTGVGLSIVQRIIHRHNGKIWAESEIDKGATFYFSLPKKGINETEEL